MKKTEVGFFLRRISCEYRDKCTSSNACCATCLRNKANMYDDKFSLDKGGYNPMNKLFNK